MASGAESICVWVRSMSSGVVNTHATAPVPMPTAAFCANVAGLGEGVFVAAANSVEVEADGGGTGFFPMTTALIWSYATRYETHEVSCRTNTRSHPAVSVFTRPRRLKESRTTCLCLDRDVVISSVRRLSSGVSTNVVSTSAAATATATESLQNHCERTAGGTKVSAAWYSDAVRVQRVPALQHDERRFQRRPLYNSRGPPAARSCRVVAKNGALGICACWAVATRFRT